MDIQEICGNEQAKRVMEIALEAAFHKGEETERKRILTDMALMGKTIPKYNSQGWIHWIDEYVNKNGLDPVKIRLSSLTTPENTEGGGV